jgi:hypothetical protein
MEYQNGQPLPSSKFPDLKVLEHHAGRRGSAVRVFEVGDAFIESGDHLIPIAQTGIGCDCKSENTCTAFARPSLCALSLCSHP